MTPKIVFYMLLSMTDGLVWLFGPMMFITMFFGYRVKSQEKSVKHLFLALIIYELIYAVVLYFVLKNGQTIGVLNGLLVMFGIVYWTFNIKEVKKGKAFLLTVFAEEIITISVIIMSSVGSIIYSELDIPVAVQLGLLLIAPFIWLGVIYFFSYLSNRNRKEPMSMSLIIVTFVTFVLIDSIMGLFDLDQESYIQPFIKLRILLNEQVDGYTMTVGVFFVFVAMVIFILLMIIKESESSYFRRKNTISEYYLEAQKEHYESLMESNREIRKIKHDMKNHMYILNELYNSQKYDELGDYLKELEEKLSHADTGVHVGNEIADAIISEKMSKVGDAGITFNFDGDMSCIEMSALDVCTIFSNIIDNAIEAVMNMPEDNRWIKLSLCNNGNFLFISEKNPTKEWIDIQENSIMTTKKDKGSHGFGIINIREAIAKYDGDMRLSVEKVSASAANGTEDTQDGYEFKIEIMLPL